MLGLSSGAAVTRLLVYVSIRWIDKLTYSYLCSRIGPTGYELSRIVFLVITNLDRQRNVTFGDASWWAAEYNWRLGHWPPHNDFYRHIDCKVQWVELQAVVSGDGVSLRPAVAQRYCDRGGWAARGYTEDATAAEKLLHWAAVKESVKQHGTARSTILLSVEPRLQALYLEITEARTLWEKLATVYKSKLKFNVFEIRQELVGIRLEDCYDVDTYASQIDQKVKDYNFCTE